MNVLGRQLLGWCRSTMARSPKGQRAGDWDGRQTSQHNRDFAEYVKIGGRFGVRVERADELPGATAHDCPAPVEIICDPELI